MNAIDSFKRIQEQQESELDPFERVQAEQDTTESIETDPFERVQKQLEDPFERVQEQQETKQKEKLLSPFGKAKQDVQKAGAQLTENLFEQIGLDPEMATPAFGEFLQSISEKDSRFAITDATKAFEDGVINEKQLNSVIKIEQVKEAVEFASIDTLDRDLRKNIIKTMEDKGNINPELAKSLQVMIDEQPNLLIDELKGIASGLTFTLSELITGPAETSFGSMGSVAGSFLNLGSIASRVAKPLINLTKEAGPVAQVALPAFFKVAGWGVEGATRKGIENLVREGELPTVKELATEGAEWAALAGVLEGAGLALEFGSAVNRIAKDFGISRKEVLRRVVKGVQKSGKDFLKGAEAITPDEILGALDDVKIAEEALQLDQKPIDVVGEGTFQEVVKGEETLSQAAKDLEATIKKSEQRLQVLQGDVIAPNPKNIEKFEALPTEVKDATLYRGVGGEPTFNVETGPVLGEGQYFAFSEDVAKTFGPDISTRQLETKNPLVISSDQDWRKWVKQNTDNKFPNPFGFETATQKQNVKNLSDAIKKAGHDAVIVHWDNSGDGDIAKDGTDIKLLRSVFEVPQVFFPEGASQVMTEGDHQDAIVNSVSTIRAAENKLADVNTQKKQGQKPSGLSATAKEQIISEGREQITPEQQATFQDSEDDSYFVNALLKDAFAKKLESTWNDLGFNVEKPFQESGAPETGFRIKNYFSELARKEEQTLAAIKKLGKLTKEQRTELALLAEKKTPPTDPKMAEAWKVVRGFFDDTFKDLQEAKVLKNPFPQSYIARLKEENKLLIDRIREKTVSRETARNEIIANNQLIAELENINFVSIPVRLWFEQEFSGNPTGAVRAVRLLNQRKRKTPTIAGMIEAGIVKPEQVDIAEIMAYYGRRTARDLGLSKIVNAAEGEGLSSSTKIPGFIEYPPWQYPALKGKYLHPKFSEWLDSFVNPSKMGIFGKVSSMVKGYMFYNPMILPFNDIVQQIMLTGLKGPLYWKQAANDLFKQTPEFWEAFENGLFSQPFNIFFDDYELMWKGSLAENKTLPAKMKQWFIQEKGINAAYRVSSNIAWAGDRIIRMASYRLLIDSGMSPREAAQTAALFHGDYAMVHPTTRKKLNRIFFTPTFKIVMGKLYSEMLKSPIRVGKAIAKGEAPSGVDKRKFWGLLGTLGIIMSFDQMYTKAFGFERVQWGRKYKKSSEDDEGVSKDLTINISNPATLPLKFFWRVMESFDPGNSTAISELIKKNRFESNPILNIAARFVENKKSDGEPIYEAFGDDSLTKLRKSLVYAAQELFPLFNVLNDNSFQDPVAKRKLEEEMGLILANIPGQFVYFGNIEEQKKANKLKEITMQLMKRARQKGLRGEELTEKEIRQYQKLLEEIAR